ncbi:hypothetical protein AU381_16185 [Sinorhizobium glycinis]|uniref:Guanylate cyclase domain-containing protein n=1 Tax=Sinorhizobium glycinis TaxID=1472378 RepID=A0A178Y5M1_9HYPH|nr:hypothetical protein [Sinorhizobium glycinis]OAP42706.1 hypothetical protein AU381_16185 [Sinorhizobium glycinis]
MPTDEAKGRHPAVVLAADVAGYSRLMSEDEEATLSVLTKYQEIIAGLVSRFVNPEQRERIRESLRKGGWQGRW